MNIECDGCEKTDSSANYVKQIRAKNLEGRGAVDEVVDGGIVGGVRALCWDFYVDLLAVMFGRDRGWCHVCGRDQVCSMDKKCPMRRYAMSVLQIEMDLSGRLT
jgi:hypothetical protein